MCVTSFNPYDSDTWPDPEEIENVTKSLDEIIQNPPEPMPSAVPQSISMPIPPMEEYSSSSESDYSQSDADNLFVNTCPGDPSIILTKLDKLRSVLATKTGHPGGQLSNTTKQFPGFIAIPLGACGLFRYPKGKHSKTCNCFIYCPTIPQDIETTRVNNPDLINIANLVNN